MQIGQGPILYVRRRDLAMKASTASLKLVLAIVSFVYGKGSVHVVVRVSRLDM
jgi:hypothetical protein